MNPINTTKKGGIAIDQGMTYDDLAGGALLRVGMQGATAIMLDFAGSKTPGERLADSMQALAEQTGITQLVGIVRENKVVAVLVDSTTEIGIDMAKLIAEGLFKSPNAKNNGRRIVHRYFAGEETTKKPVFRNIVFANGNVVDLNSGMQARTIQVAELPHGLEIALVNTEGTLFKAELTWRTLKMIATIDYGKALDTKPVRAMFVTNDDNGQVIELVSYRGENGIYLNGHLIEGTEQVRASTFFDEPTKPNTVHTVVKGRTLYDIELSVGKQATIKMVGKLDDEVLEVLPAPAAKKAGHRSLVGLKFGAEGFEVSPQILAAA